MTSEIVLMNRRAVALAADSATTSQYWSGSKWETRYFKGANKIFNLIDDHPVGLMTFDSANVQGAPWEVVIKAFRDDAGTHPKDNLSEYASSICDFMANNSHLFPIDYQKKQFVNTAHEAAMIVMITILDSEKFPKDGKKAERVAYAKRQIVRHAKSLKQGSFIGSADADSIRELIPQHISDVSDAVSEEQTYEANKDIFPLQELAEIGIWGVFNKDMPNLDKTGLVITGFGDKEYFPETLQYTCYGPILGKVYNDTGKSYRVDQKNVSEIVPLAQDEMITTFAYGLGAKARDQIEIELIRALDTFEEGLRSEHNLTDGTDDLRENVRKQFSDAIIAYMYRSHVRQLRLAIGMLPINELAELAETLILIESLKERVSGASESVGGPIDVAAISKGDGFIWIKRKHYFERELNPRYFANLKS